MQVDLAKRKREVDFEGEDEDLQPGAELQEQELLPNNMSYPMVRPPWVTDLAQEVADKAVQNMELRLGTIESFVKKTSADV